jgi:hypothetical protein
MRWVFVRRTLEVAEYAAKFAPSWGQLWLLIGAMG